MAEGEYTALRMLSEPHHIIMINNVVTPFTVAGGVRSAGPPELSKPFPALCAKDAAENCADDVGKKVAPTCLSAKERLDDLDQTAIGADTKNNRPNKSGAREGQWKRQCCKSECVMQFVGTRHALA